MHQDQPDVSDGRNSGARDALYAGYGIATFAASIATFGEGGVVLGIVVPLYWACIFAAARTAWFRTALMIPLAFIGLFVAAMFTPLHGPGHREAQRRMSCSSNLRKIAAAVHNYYDVYRSFPPAYVKDEDGRRMHGWRVLILPYLEGQQQLHDNYKLDEPWDSPHNRELVLQMPQVFCCPSQCKRGSEPTGFTNYFAVVGRGTAWPGERSIGFLDITDGVSNTLLLIEATNRPIAWTEPTDIEYADAINLLTAGDLAAHPSVSFFYDRPVGYNVALADGSMQFVAQQVDKATSDSLITRNGGKRFDIDALYNNVASSMRLRVGNCIRLGVFVLLALWPFPWVWVKRRETRTAIHSDREMDPTADLDG